ncbi:uncharacterized protein LOC136751885 [Amia ocellicauda]|uniref:uncharacterized protein LOC136751885 n=1 Tax=Amia ocellicauda TaxID=2972642 RepID=UPI00346401EB
MEEKEVYNGACYTGARYQEAEDTQQELGEDERMKQEEVKVCEANEPLISVTIVLCGRSGVGKTALADTLLALGELRAEPSSSSESPRWCWRQGQVSGHRLSVLEMPSLSDTRLSKQQLMKETWHYLSLCDPGVHAFLLVTPALPLTDEDQQEAQLIQELFSQRVSDYCIVLLTCGDTLNRDTAAESLEKSMLVQKFGGRSHVFNKSPESSAQVSKLLEHIDTMSSATAQHCYTLDMYLQAKVDLLVDQKLQEMAKYKSDL